MLGWDRERRGQDLGRHRGRPGPPAPRATRSSCRRRDYAALVKRPVPPSNDTHSSITSLRASLQLAGYCRGENWHRSSSATTADSRLVTMLKSCWPPRRCKPPKLGRHGCNWLRQNFRGVHRPRPVRKSNFGRVPLTVDATSSSVGGLVSPQDPRRFHAMWTVLFSRGTGPIELLEVANNNEGVGIVVVDGTVAGSSAADSALQNDPLARRSSRPRMMTPWTLWAASRATRSSWS